MGYFSTKAYVRSTVYTYSVINTAQYLVEKGYSNGALQRQPVIFLPGHAAFDTLSLSEQPSDMPGT